MRSRQVLLCLNVGLVGGAKIISFLFFMTDDMFYRCPYMLMVVGDIQMMLICCRTNHTVRGHNLGCYTHSSLSTRMS
jgi:hypothetical protein